MRVVFWGTPDFAVPTLAALLEHPTYEVVGVVTQPDRRRGRGSQRTPSPVKCLAESQGIPVWQPEKVKQDQPTLNALANTRADWFVVVAYGQILSTQILEMPRYGCVNNHASLLPKYRGAAPIAWAIYHGETETGITTMQMEAGLDTGPMLLQQALPIDLWITAPELGDRLAHLGADLLIQTLDQWFSLTPMPQQDCQATYAPLIQKKDYWLNWQRSAVALHNQIRAFTPSAYTLYQGTPLKIITSLPLEAAYVAALDANKRAVLANLSLPPSPRAGTLVAMAKELGPVVQCGQGQLLILAAQLAGKRQQSGWDLANGLRLPLGSHFGE